VGRHTAELAAMVSQAYWGAGGWCTVMQWRARIVPGRSWWSDDGVRGLGLLLPWFKPKERALALTGRKEHGPLARALAEKTSKIAGAWLLGALGWSGAQPRRSSQVWGAAVIGGEGRN